MAERRVTLLRCLGCGQGFTLASEAVSMETLLALFLAHEQTCTAESIRDAEVAS